MNKFDNCCHNWEFHINADESWWPEMKPRQSFFICHTCNNVITLQEKCALDQIAANQKSLTIQERQSKISKWATVVSAIVLIVAFLTFLFGDKIVR